MNKAGAVGQPADGASPAVQAGTRAGRVLPLLTLFVLAPWIGEYLLGNVPGTWLWALPILAPMYGGGAILVREVAVRAGLGWTGILLLGVSYGLIEAGLVDQGLFNPDLLERGSPGATHLPGIGVTVADALAYLAGHAIWSIGLAIAFAQFLFPRAAGMPWLGPVSGLVTLGLYLFGCWIILGDVIETGGFLASRAQHVGALLAAVAVAALAFVPWPRVRPLRPPRPVWTGLLGFALASGMVIASETWGGVAVKLVILGLWAGLTLAMTGHAAWTPRHAVAYAGGILMTYAWLGPVLTTLVHGGGAALYLWNAGFAVMAAGLIALAWRRVGAGYG